VDLYFDFLKNKRIGYKAKIASGSLGDGKIRLHGNNSFA